MRESYQKSLEAFGELFSEWQPTHGVVNSFGVLQHRATNEALAKDWVLRKKRKDYKVVPLDEKGQVEHLPPLT